MNYETICRALWLISEDLNDIATQTQEFITLAQAQECHAHLSTILRQLILASRIGNLPIQWRAVYSTQKIASIISQSSIETSTACASTQTSEQC